MPASSLHAAWGPGWDVMQVPGTRANGFPHGEAKPGAVESKPRPGPSQELLFVTVNSLVPPPVPLQYWTVD